MMWSEMKAILFWTWITAFALWALATPPALAQGDVEADAGSLAHGFAYDGNQPLSSLTVGYDPRMLEAPETSASDRAAFCMLRIALTIARCAQRPIEPRWQTVPSVQIAPSR